MKPSTLPFIAPVTPSRPYYFSLYFSFYDICKFLLQHFLTLFRNFNTKEFNGNLINGNRGVSIEFDFLTIVPVQLFVSVQCDQVGFSVCKTKPTRSQLTKSELIKKRKQKYNSDFDGVWVDGMVTLTVMNRRDVRFKL